jgi:hypothetical protein
MPAELRSSNTVRPVRINGTARFEAPADAEAGGVAAHSGSAAHSGVQAETVRVCAQRDMLAQAGSVRRGRRRRFTG